MSNKQTARLYQAHQAEISKQRGIPITGSVNGQDLDRVYHRASLMTLLDITLESHRAKHSNNLIPLRGKEALTHLILTKYKWPIDIINKMSLSDSILAINDELFPSQPHELAKQFLDNVNAQYLFESFDDMPDSDWNPTLHEPFLRLRD